MSLAQVASEVLQGDHGQESIVINKAKHMSKMLKEKTLNAHPDKSGIIVQGFSTFQTKIKEEMGGEEIQLNKLNLKL